MTVPDPGRLPFLFPTSNLGSVPYTPPLFHIDGRNTGAFSRYTHFFTLSFLNSWASGAQNPSWAPRSGSKKLQNAGMYRGNCMNFEILLQIDLQLSHVVSASVGSHVSSKRKGLRYLHLESRLIRN